MQSLEMIKPFNKEELIGIFIIFLILVGISAPNFVLSLRRARDQIRRDDMGFMQHSLDLYQADFGVFPESSADGKVLGCKKPEDKVTIDSKGRLIVNLIPCQWGKDSLMDLTPGSSKVYAKVLPGDPRLSEGTSYLYLSDGVFYQFFVALEGGKDEAGYESGAVLRNFSCGNKICNAGRFSGCPLEKTISQCEAERGKK